MAPEFPVQEHGLHLGDAANAVQRLREAIARNEFQLYCQPILALYGSVRYPMAEILVRMRQEERALLPPGAFLPVFEHYGLMPELDRWVVRGVAGRLARGSRVPAFTVNVSGQTLEDPQFAACVEGEIRKARIPPGSLLFEIDESDVLGRPEAASRLAGGLKALGCGVLIDGFGRRAVGLATLRLLHVDYLKIDGSVVRRLLASEAARFKINAMLHLADSLHIGLVAECVEEQAVLVRLKAMDVGYAQGFGVYEPQPLDSIADPVPFST
jgi:Amt family ammonium transporter